MDSGSGSRPLEYREAAAAVTIHEEVPVFVGVFPLYI
jgi:hypothetical protein